MITKRIILICILSGIILNGIAQSDTTNTFRKFGASAFI